MGIRHFRLVDSDGLGTTSPTVEGNGARQLLGDKLIPPVGNPFIGIRHGKSLYPWDPLKKNS